MPFPGAFGSGGLAYYTTDGNTRLSFQFGCPNFADNYASANPTQGNPYVVTGPYSPTGPLVGTPFDCYFDLRDCEILISISIVTYSVWPGNRRPGGFRSLNIGEDGEEEPEGELNETENS